MDPFDATIEMVDVASSVPVNALCVISLRVQQASIEDVRKREASAAFQGV